ncbi:MAG: carboxylesterase/lipase family protein [Candidatus Helarchaeota archaeon]|nr:carboxylesterase/lipase family protein [Candidatus Helarchaeota archaeon]
MKTIAETKKIIVETKSGKVQGYRSKGIQIFKGIPYAAPPIGALRFSPPAPREPWKDVLDATKFGPYAMQGFNALEILFGKLPIQESEADCLTLNVWTPETDDAKRPVMVWIHGGAFTTGSGAIPIYDGAPLALQGNIVVVTINYRLGALGFLYIPGVTANAGLLDQIAALDWIKNNIEVFGGDPNNVTIFGESAGGMSVTTLLAMPAAKGFFHHAISQSGATRPTLSTDKQSSETFMKKLRIEIDDIDALREVPTKKIVKIQNRITLKGGMTNILAFSPRVDGKTLPKHPLEAVRAGSASDVDLLIGTNLDEMKLFSALLPSMRKIDADGLYKLLQTVTGLMGIDESKVRQLIEIYQEARETPREIIDAIGTDFIFRIPSIRIAEAHHIHQPNTYNYLFTWPSPLFKGRLGSCHAVEIPFVFSTYAIPRIDTFVGKGAAVKILSDKMMDTWIAFARTGNPNHDSIPEWPPYDVEKRTTMLIGSEFKVVEAFYEKERAAWDGII